MSDYRIFESLPGIAALVSIDSPRYAILATTEDLKIATGCSSDQLTGTSYTEYFVRHAGHDSNSADLLRSSFEHVLKFKSLHHIPVFRYIAESNGEQREYYWSVNNKPVFSDKGEIVNIIFSATDISVQVKNGEENQSGTSKAYQLFKQAPVAVCIVKGPDYLVELANDSMLQFLGRTAEIIGHPIIQALPEARLQGLIGILDYVFSTGEPRHISTFPATIKIDGELHLRYFDVIFQLYDQQEKGIESRSVFCVAHNITGQVLDRKKVAEVQETLNFRNALFEAQNEATPEGILIVDKDGNMLLHNRNFMDLWRMPQHIMDSKDDKAALAHAMTMLMNPDDFLEVVSRIYNNQSKPSRDVLLFNDGRVVERNGIPIVDDAGTYYGWAWYFRDVTERIQQEQKFQHVLQQTPDPVLILKGSELILEVANAAVYKYWELDENAIGKPFQNILPELRTATTTEILHHVFRTGIGSHDFEVPVLSTGPSGQKITYYFNFQYQPYREINNTITGVLISGADVTGQVLVKQQLIESENNLRNTILQAPVAMCILVGEDYKMEIANSRLFDLLGKSEDDLMNKPVLLGLPELAPQGFEELLDRVYQNGETVSGFGYPLKLFQQGRSQVNFVSFVYQPFRVGNGTITGIIAVLIDVTEQVLARKKLEANELELQARVQERTLELHTKNQELQRSNADLEEFAYAASHDLKEPIRKILVFSDRLKRELHETLTETQQYLLSRLESASVRMGDLVDDILTYSKLNDGNLELETVDLNKACSLVLDDLEVAIQEKSAQIIAAPLPTIKGYKRQIHQLFQNLIGNALKYSKAGIAPVITINATTTSGELVTDLFPLCDPAKAYYQVEISDNGIGFDQEHAEVIFKVFTRLHTSSEYRGTGVGLSIVRRVISNHHGYIRAESTPGVGSTFTFLLPIID